MDFNNVTKASRDAAKAARDAAASLVGAALFRGKEGEHKEPETVLMDLVAPRNVAGKRRRLLIQVAAAVLGLILLAAVLSRRQAPPQPVTGPTDNLQDKELTKVEVKPSAEALNKAEKLLEDERKLREAMERDALASEARKEGGAEGNKADFEVAETEKSLGEAPAKLLPAGGPLGMKVQEKSDDDDGEEDAEGEKSKLPGGAPGARTEQAVEAPGAAQGAALAVHLEEIKSADDDKKEEKKAEGDREAKESEGESKGSEGEAKESEGEIKEGETREGEGETKEVEGEAKKGEGESTSGEEGGKSETRSGTKEGEQRPAWETKGGSEEEKKDEGSGTGKGVGNGYKDKGDDGEAGGAADKEGGEAKEEEGGDSLEAKEEEGGASGAGEKDGAKGNVEAAATEKDEEEEERADPGKAAPNESRGNAESDAKERDGKAKEEAGAGEKDEGKENVEAAGKPEDKGGKDGAAVGKSEVTKDEEEEEAKTGKGEATASAGTAAAESAPAEAEGGKGEKDGKALPGGKEEDQDYEEGGKEEEPKEDAVAAAAEESKAGEAQEVDEKGKESEELSVSDFSKDESSASGTDDVTAGELTQDEEADRAATAELEKPAPAAQSREAKIVAAVAEKMAADPVRLGDPLECKGRMVYIYPLPARFNRALVEQCQTLLPWYNMCPHFLNHGLGKLMPKSSFLKPGARWFETHSYAIEMVFHYRLRRGYTCITDDPEKADMLYVPFYASLDVMRWHYRKDATLEATNHLSHSLIRWLSKHQSFRRFNGSDHVLMLGKVTWDFRRHGSSTWGNDFLLQPEMKYVTRLVLEASKWDKSDVAVPHLTYFHPRQENDLGVWQSEVKGHARSILVSFAALRGMYPPAKDALAKQCKNDPKHCRFMDCQEDVCRRPEAVLGLYLDSTFCLQPPGYESVRRAPFDAMLAGCIPVFFDDFFLTQYTWHLPADPTLYSVHFAESDVLSGKVNVVEELKSFGARRARKMRKNMIHTVLPGLLYNHPRAKPMVDHEDAFDITMDKLFKHIKKQKAKISPLKEDPFAPI